MADALKLTPIAYEYAQRLFELAEPLQKELGMTGGHVAEGAAIFAGLVVGANAKPGHGAIVGEMAAAIVRDLAGMVRPPATH